jgi:hypothetical protein
MAAGRRSPSLGERVSRAISQFAGEGCLTPFLDGRTLQGRNRTWRAFGRRSGRLKRQGEAPAASDSRSAAPFLGWVARGKGHWNSERSTRLGRVGLIRDKPRQFPRPLTLKTCRWRVRCRRSRRALQAGSKGGAPGRFNAEPHLPAGAPFRQSWRPDRITPD